MTILWEIIILEKDRFTVNQKGYTLIELLIVLSLMGIIASSIAILIDPAGQLAKGRDARRKADFQALRSVFEVYYNVNGMYPSLGPEYNTVDGIYFGSPWPNYMDLLPNDPISLGINVPVKGGTDVHYQFITYNNRQAYCLYANIENPTDLHLCNNGNVCPEIQYFPNPNFIHCSYSPSKMCNYRMCSSGFTPASNGSTPSP